MKIAVNIVTYFFALIFVVFGANYFINFMPMPPATGIVGQYTQILVGTHYLLVVKILEIGAGLMLLANFKRALAWLLILPVVVNIMLFEVLISGQPGIGIFLFALNLFGIWSKKDHYQGLLR